jgi:hypothetical protein
LRRSRGFRGPRWLTVLLALVTLGVWVYQTLHTQPTSRPSNTRPSSPNSTSPSDNPNGSTSSSRAARTAPLLPDASLTPGDVLTTDLNRICTPGYTQTVRDVPSDLKRQVYAQYGIRSHKPGDYEVDHLISLELGGSNSVRNLWPESFVTKPLNAHVKDEVENKLHELICNRQISVETAQRAIASDWTAAYRKYVGALPQ